MLQAVYALDYPKKQLRLVLHDDGSTDSTRDVMESFLKRNRDRYQETVLISSEQSEGHYNIPRARNKCLQHAKGHVFFVDSDVIVPREALRLLLEPFKDPSVGQACIPYGYSEEELKRQVQPGDVSLTLGCTLLRDTLLAAIGQFDERFLATDDLWLYYRAKKLRYKTAIIRECRCLHLNPWRFSRQLKKKLTDTPRWHLLLLREGLADWEIVRRYLYYFALLVSLLLATMTPVLFQGGMAYSVLSLLLFCALVVVGVIHYGSVRRFMLYGLLTGFSLSIGLLLAILDPRNWRL